MNKTTELRVNQFKIIHLKSKTNREKNFDVTEELRDLTKNNGTTTSGSKKKSENNLWLWSKIR